MLPILLAVASAVSCDTIPCFKLAGGNELPQVAMGTWKGSYSDCSSGDFSCAGEHAKFASETWLRLGGTHIDGANDYRTQTAIADALATVPRESLYVTTKCPGPMGYEATIQCADDNLQMLGQMGTKGYGYIDLLLIHFPFKLTAECRFAGTKPSPPDCMQEATEAELQDTWRAMEELKRLGVVKAIGVSDYAESHLKSTLAKATMPIELNQVEWNPSKHDESLLEFCKAHGIQLQAWSPLGGQSGSVLSHPTVVSIANAHNVSTAQVTLRWSLQRGVAVVVGSANPVHLASDLDVFKFTLADDEVAKISALQASPVVV